MAQAPTTMLTQQLLFIDSRIEDRESLLTGLKPNTQVIVLDADRDGVAQISEVLAKHRDIDAMHIISHGQSGSLSLGNGVLDSTSLEDQRDALQGWKDSLTENADLLLYGCNVAEGEQGQAFVDTLAEFTGADVAASDDLTGAAASGGDWQLETRVGEIDQRNVIQSSAYQGILADPTLDVTKSPALMAVDEDLAAPTNGSTAGSTLVSALIDNGGPLGNFADTDGDEPGIAITGVSEKGTLYYSTDGGANWTEAPDGLDTYKALVLFADANTWLHFVPDENVAGNITDAITFKAWDRSGGYAVGSTTTTGGSTPFSADPDTASVTVNPVNDTPNISTLTLSTPFVENGDSIAFQLDDDFEYLGSLSESGGDAFDGPYSVTVSPDGKYVYLPASSKDKVGIFSRDPVTGALTREDTASGSGGSLDGVRALVISVDGSHAYAVAGTADTVVFFTRDPDTGLLTYQSHIKDNSTVDGETVDGLDAPYAITFSPDEKYIYIAAEKDNAVSIFQRDTTTGALTYIGLVKDDADGGNSLGGVTSVTVSPDGLHLYAAARDEDAITLFTRDSDTGALTYQAHIANGAGVENALEYPRSVTVSPDGKHVYVATKDSHSVVVFTRNETSGELTYRGKVDQASDSIDGLNGAAAVEVSPDGTRVFVSSTGDNDALVIFSRDPDTGLLTFISETIDGAGAADSLGSAYGLDISSDGRHVYVAGKSDDAVSWFGSNPIADAELGALNDGKGDYSGAILTIARQSGANSDDQFTIASENGLTVSGNNISDGSNIFATFTNSNGQLEISFTGANGTKPTTALLSALWLSISYSNSNDTPPASVTLDISLNDKNSGSQGTGGEQTGTGSVTINITSSNDAPAFKVSTGKQITDLGGTDAGSSIAVQADGKILLAGTRDNDFALVRYHADGSPDTGFGDSGQVVTDLGGDDSVDRLFILSDGKIGAVGGSDNNLAMANYDSHGSLDIDYGDQGKWIDSEGFFSGSSLVLLADGNFLQAKAKDGKLSVTRLLMEGEGAPDPGFGTDGEVVTDLTYQNGSNGVYEQPDGKILLTGENDGTLTLLCYEANGSPDTGFGTNGKMTIDLTGLVDDVNSVAVQADGKILLAGTSNNDFALLRYKADGSLDTGFGSNGKVVTDLGDADKGHSVVVQADGKILLAGTSDDDFALLRYKADGSLDTGFGVLPLNGTQAYTEGSDPVVLHNNVQLADPELDAAGSYEGATLQIERAGAANSEDQFSHSGDLAALTEDADLVVDNTIIGTVTQNSGGILKLTFNSAATSTLVNKALQQISYSNSSDTPPASVQLDYLFDDGDSSDAQQATGSVTVNITPANDKPVISALSGDAVNNYRAGNGAVPINQGTADITVADPDSMNFDTGTLTVSITSGEVANEDILAIGNGDVSVSDSDVAYGTTTIGTVAGGTAGTDLVITFNAEADATSIAALLTHITYENNSNSPTTTARTIDFVLTDGDGGISATSSTTVNFYVAPPPTPAPTPSPEPEPPKELVDGVEVEKQEETDDNGNTTSRVIIDPVAEGRQEDTNTDNGNKADVPLRQEDDGNAALAVALPVGVGITAEGNDKARRADDSLTDLIRLIEETADERAEAIDKDDMLQGGKAFLEALQDENLWVNKITLTTDSDTAPSEAIVVSGNTDTTTESGDDNSRAALVIDASTLPTGTELQLQDVEFAVIVGEAKLRGGEGQNTVYAGAGSQDIVLGADDDQLYGGAGNDTLGSEGGDDRLFGEGGNDTLFGGEGNDTLHGGADIDVAVYDGNLADYDLVQTNGVITVTRKDDSSDSDTLVNIEQVQFADDNYLATYDTEQKALATLYQNVLGRQADLAGFQWWAEQLGNGGSFGDTILGFMQSDEYQGLQDQSFMDLANDQQLDELYQAVLGRAADDAGKAYWQAEFEAGMNILDVAHSFATSAELLGQLKLAHQWEFTL